MDEPNRLTKTKEQWAKARRGGEEREVFYEGDARLPPGQHLVETFPVLDLGFKPEVPLTEWSLTIGGFVTTPVTWTWEQFLATTPIQGRLGLPLRDELEPVRQRVGRGQFQAHSIRGEAAVFGKVRPLQVVRRLHHQFAA